MTYMNTCIRATVLSVLRNRYFVKQSYSSRLYFFFCIIAILTYSFRKFCFVCQLPGIDFSYLISDNENKAKDLLPLPKQGNKKHPQRSMEKYSRFRGMGPVFQLWPYPVSRQNSSAHKTVCTIRGRQDPQSIYRPQ